MTLKQEFSEAFGRAIYDIGSSLIGVADETPQEILEGVARELLTMKNVFDDVLEAGLSNQVDSDILKRLKNEVSSVGNEPIKTKELSDDPIIAYQTGYRNAKEDILRLLKNGRC